MTSGIILEAGGILLHLKQFSKASFPRQKINAAIGVSFSAWGTPAIGGPIFTPKFIWNLVPMLTPEEAETLAILEVLGESQDILLTDYTDRVWEVGDHTRAIAALDTPVTRGLATGYHAQFYARFTQPTDQQPDGIYRLCSVQLTETGKTAP